MCAGGSSTLAVPPDLLLHQAGSFLPRTMLLDKLSKGMKGKRKEQEELAEVDSSDLEGKAFVMLQVGDHPLFPASPTEATLRGRFSAPLGKQCTELSGIWY